MRARSAFHLWIAWKGKTHLNDSPEQVFSLASQLHRQGRLQEAEAGYRQVIAQAPDHADALNLLGVVSCQLGRGAEGVDLIRQAVALKPTSAHYRANLAVALAQLGRRDEAILALREAVLFQSDVPEIHYNLANLLRDDGKLQEAADAYQQAISLRPNYAQALNNLGLVQARLNRLPEAIQAYREAVAAEPAHAGAWTNLAEALTEQGDVEEALQAHQRAAQLKPQSPQSLGALGNALHLAGRLDEALTTFRASLALAPDLAETHYSIGNVLKDKGELDEAIRSYDEALKLRPDYADANWNRTLAILLKGDLERGWPGYEARWREADEKIDLPLWDGSHLLRQRILLRLEQGLGDMIQFIRYAPMVAERGGKVVIQCPPELRRLFEGQCRITQVTSTDEPTPKAEVWFPLLSLAGLFHTTLDTIPREVPYLLADAESVERWDARIRQQPGELKVGLVWAGSPKYLQDRQRSIPMKAFAPLGEISGVSFFSLQKGTVNQQSRDQAAALQLVDWTEDLRDMADTAALIANLDLVISCDTSVAHLAGAMGKSVWMLLPFAPDWRWLLARSDSPWYPTMRLFRQPLPGDWQSPIGQITSELAKFRPLG